MLQPLINSCPCPDVAPTPFNHLPIEILIHIFELVPRGKNAADLTEELESKAVFPHTALGVCRLWREVALNTPSLWRVAAITTHPAWVSRLATCLDMNKCRPMDLNVYHDSSHVWAFRDAIRWMTVTRRQDCTKIETSSMTVRVIIPGGAGLRIEWLDPLLPVTLAIKSLEVISEPPAAFYNPYVMYNLCLDIPCLCGLRSLIFHGITLGELQVGRMDLRELVLLEELRLEACQGHILTILRVVNSPVLRSVAIDCSALPANPTAFQHIYFLDLHLSSVRHLILYNVPDQQIARCILSSASNATRIAFRCTESLVLEDLLFGVVKFCPDLTSLAILHPLPGMREIKEIAKSRLSKLRTLELHGVRNGPLPTEEANWFEDRVDLKLVEQTEDGYMETWAESGISIGLPAV
ncbi:hypothetical protein FRB97_008013 [Tulasnella sp. 331]|nr:hypothetical protein FRB97_008013 [Tulasnella sp. 331]